MANKWVKMDVTTYDPAAKSTAGTAQPSKALKALVRGGIPSALRPAVWLHFSGGAAKKAAASAGFYSNLQRRSAAGTVDAAELAAELSRAFGTHPLLSSIKGMRSVLRILEVCQLPKTSHLPIDLLLIDLLMQARLILGGVAVLIYVQAFLGREKLCLKVARVERNAS